MKISRAAVVAALLLNALIVLPPADAALSERRLIRNSRFFETAVPSTTDFLQAGDFNRDGRQDVLVFSAESVAVYAGDGSGLFAKGLVTPAVGFTAEGAADFNGDGVPDVHLREKEGRGFGVMLGAGDGTFRSVVSYGVPGPIQRTAAGDFNRDGRIDVVVLPANGSPLLYAGNGDGGFTGPPGNGTGGCCQIYEAAMTGDFDGDGNLDVAFRSGSSTGLYFGTPGGTFDGSVGVTGGRSVMADLDGDGKSDLVVMGSESSFDSPAVYFGNAARTLTAQPIPAHGWNAALAADVDRDGRPELIGFKGERFGISHSLGAGKLSRMRAFDIGSSIWNLAVADFDGDLNPDLVTLHGTYFGLTRGLGDGRFQAARAFDSGLRASHDGNAIDFADVNGDGLADVMTSGSTSSLPSFALAVFFATESGDYEEPVLTPFEPGSEPRATPAGDLNGDNIPDFITWNAEGYPSTTRWTVMTGRRDGGFTKGYSWLGAYYARLARIADVTADGHADLIDHHGNIYPGNGNGSFAAPRPDTLPDPTTTLLADVNADGRLDLLSGSGNWIKVRFGRGDGTYAAAIETFGYGLSAFGDMNGDGFLDIIESNGVRLGGGDGSFGATISSLELGFGGSIEEARPAVNPGGRWNTGDFDGDGHLDVASGHSVCFGDGTGRFTAIAQLRGSRNSGSSPLPADIDGDGRPELMVPPATFVKVGGVAPGTLQSTLSLTLPEGPTEYGRAFAVTAAVSTAIPSALLASGRVRFSGARYERVVPIDWTGKATAYLFVEVGSNTITATYEGDDHLAGSSASAPHTGVVSPTVSEVRLPEYVSYSYGSPVRLGAGVKTLSAGGSMPPGDVILKKGTVTLGALPNSSQWLPEWLSINDREIFTVGAHSITAHYPGDGNYLASTSDPVTIHVDKAVPPMVLTVPTGSLIVGQSASFKVDFTDRPYLTGTVTFSIEDVVIGSVSVANGSASVTTTLSEWGFRRRVLAEYSGDGNHYSGHETATIDVAREALQATPFVRTIPRFEFNAWRIEVIVSPVAGATHYDVYRRIAGGDWTFWQTFQPVTFWWASDMNVPSGEARFYKAVARADGMVSQAGPPAIGLAMRFTDDPIIAGGSVIKAVHISELQNATNAVRIATGLPAFAFASVSAGGVIRAVDVADLHRTFTEACSSAGVTLSLTAPAPGAGVPIRAAHIQELRNHTR